MKSTATDTEAAAQTGLTLKLATRHHEIVNLLALLGHGECLDCLADDIREVERAVSDTGKAGEVTLKIKIAPNGHNKRVLTFEDKVKKPVVAASSTYVFATELGQYVENDPDQRDLPLNVTEIGKAAAPKVVNG